VLAIREKHGADLFVIDPDDRDWLPEREAMWRQDPMWVLMEEQQRRLNLPFESLAQRKEKLRQAGD
jgi:hypothetical protein